jgi:acetylornithine deacetylase/succinyl-diaminopimelate desuccinylase-like protein
MRERKTVLLVVLLLSMSTLLLPAAGGARQTAVPGTEVVAATSSYREANEHRIIDELIEFLRIPNVAGDRTNIRANAEWLLRAMRARDIDARLFETEGSPYVFGELRVPGAQRTLLFYCHYDGQPADPARWVGHQPWQPVFRDGRLEDGAEIIPLPAGPIDPQWRVYARSASDDRAPIIMLLTALDALRDAGIALDSNIKFLFEGDEEAGSPYMGEVAERFGNELAADVVFFADGPKHPSGRPTLTFGARGITTVQLTVYGPSQPLHSGHYGNWAPNPAMRLAQLLASMKDPDSDRVLIDGWYDDRTPLTDTELAALERIPDDPAQSPQALGFARPEGEWQRRVEAITYPSLNVRGLSSAWVADETRTIVPDAAIAELDLRLVLDIRPAQQVERLKTHIRAQGFHIVDRDPDAETRAQYPLLIKVVQGEFGYPAARTSMDLPISRDVIERLRGAFGVEPVALPTTGGSVPLYAFTETLGAPTILVPTVNHDNNQHSPNENLRIENLWRGIEILAVLLTL